MYRIKTLPEFDDWLQALPVEIHAVVVLRIKKLRRGLMSDNKPLGEGLFEFRINWGAGWRLYFAHQAGQIVLLLAGGSKGTQDRDIRHVRKLLQRIKQTGGNHGNTIH